MKLSKVLSLVLAVVMLFGMQAFAFTDVAETANYAEAVTVLSALDIINGYEDGTFKPEGKITRAEYSAIVCRILDMGDAGANQVGGYFTDVAADHWASGYIATASQLGIVNGMGDGTFAPEAEVTYEQSVAMLVRALGYERKAQSMGGYPTGYMMIANQESITVGTTNTAGGAARATVARLTYNALTVPMMDQVSWGSEEQFKPINTQSLLYTKLNAVKAEVTFATVPLNKTTTDVTLSYTAADLDKVAQANVAEGNLSLQYNVKINGVDLAGLQGLKATAIIDKADSAEWKLVCVVPKAGKNVEITVDPQMMAEVSTADGYVEYYKTNDDDKTTKIKVPTAGLTTYKNLVAGTYGTDVVVGGHDSDLAYRFVDTDNNGTYETVFVDNAEIFVVGNVNAANGKIYRDADTGALATTSAPAVITLDEEDDNLDWTITDVDGNVMEIADIEAGDIVVVATSASGSDVVYEIVIAGETIEGTVSQTYTETKKADGTTTLYKFTIGDADYSLLTNANSIKPGDEISAIVFGDKVVSYELAKGVKNYGLVIATNLATDFGSTYQIQMLTQKGEIATFNLAEKVNGITATYANQTALDAAFPAGKIVAYALNKDGEIKSFDIENSTLTHNVTEANDRVAIDSSVQYKESSEKLGSYYITDNTVIFTTETIRTGITKTNVALSSRDILEEDNTYTASILYNENKEAEVVVLIAASNQVNMNSYPLVVTKKATVTVEGDTRTKLFGYVNGEEVEMIVADNADYTVVGRADDTTTPLVDETVKALDVADIAMVATNGAGEIVKAVRVVEKGTTGFTVLDSAIEGALDDAKTAQTANKVLLKTADYTNPTTAAAAQTVAGTLMTKETTATGSVKGFGVAGKLYSVSGKNFRVLNAANYAASFNGTANRLYDSIVDAGDDAKISDYSVNSSAVAYKYNAKNGKFTVTTLLDAETDITTFDSKNGAQIENDDLVYAFNYDGETKLVLIIDVQGK